jgi:hypothetical protein
MSGALMIVPLPVPAVLKVTDDTQTSKVAVNVNAPEVEANDTIESLLTTAPLQPRNPKEPPDRGMASAVTTVPAVNEWSAHPGELGGVTRISPRVASLTDNVMTVPHSANVADSVIEDAGMV